MYRILLGVVAALLLALSAPAQDAQEAEDRGFLEGLLEDNLSGAGRDVRIQGFQGALSSTARIAELTVSDDDGVWLTVRDIVLDWNRSALLRGALDVTEFSAAEVVMPRLPVSETESMPAPEASGGFSLPDLPVSVDIGALRVERAEFGAPVLGQELIAELEGAASLAGGEGSAQLRIARVDGMEGEFALQGGYSNATEVLDLSLALREGDGGIAATKLGVPGTPALALTVEGSGELDDFGADIALETEGEPRLSGNVQLRGTEEGDRQFAANLNGDLRPLLDTQYHEFLGDRVSLEVGGIARSTGGLEIDALAVEAQALSLAGMLTLDAQNWPAKIDLSGRIGLPSGEPVTLPVPGEPTDLRSATISLRFDAAEGDRWALELDADGVERAATEIAVLRVTGAGALTRGEGTAPGSVSGTVDMRAEGLGLADAGLQEAVGEALGGTINFDWTQGEPLRLPKVELSGSDYALSGDLTIAGVEGQVDLRAGGTISLSAQDLSRFAGLAGQSISGSARLDVEGSMTPVSGGFDLRIAGRTNDLGIGQAQLDPLIAGETNVALAARRDALGLALDGINISSPAAQIFGSARLNSTASQADLRLTVFDAALFTPGLSGEAALSFEARQQNEQWAVFATLEGADGLRGNAVVETTLRDGVLGATSGTLSADIPQISVLSELAGRPLGGSISVEAEGEGNLSLGTGSISLDANGQNLSLGVAELDQLMAGRTSLVADVTRIDDGTLEIGRMEVDAPLVSAQVSGRYGPNESRVALTARLANLGIFVEDLPGPVEADGTLTRPSASADWGIDAVLSAPGGTRARVTGSAAPDTSRLDLSADGNAPLGLANRFITPRTLTGSADFNLAVNGAPQLSSLSGRITTSGARLALPQVGAALRGIDATVNLSTGRAEIDLTAQVAEGGRLAISGPVTLTAPFAGDLAVELDEVDYVRPGLLATTVDGELALAGPLTGGARLAGRLTLGETEIRIPAAGGATAVALPELEHRNEPAAVRQSRIRAGLLTEDTPSANGPAYGLEIEVVAPSRVFVRGRGLDAELGGTVQLRGTTRTPITEGRFELIRGRLDILGQRLSLTEGLVRLQGDFNPEISIVAGTTNAETDIAITVAGPSTDPQVSFSSNPDLPEDEILSRLLFGRDISEISALQALRIANAVRTLAGYGGEGMLSRLREDFGVDDLDLSTDEEGNTGVTVGKYISDNIYTDVTVDSTGRSEINLNLNVTPSITARGSVANDGDTGIGVFFERDY
ncbi:translocation/assembly module TamB domain-containing protein [Poseidonocella pacifica]|uniref:translocation/assembly module TamB domain-containing protein n=1 Tax=Poseidonocella pacifica TaxID=871651 RepID=UPI001FDF90C6|nr:translocation/assembly module TamB domain-containing protein [Poseidonocella pacifica]